MFKQNVSILITGFVERVVERNTCLVAYLKAGVCSHPQSSAVARILSLPERRATCCKQGDVVSKQGDISALREKVVVLIAQSCSLIDHIFIS
jgi:hypothetical protein